mgnify:CR=1 FL=1
MAQSDFEQESTANATWSRMLQGNRRFAEGKPDHPWQDQETRQTLLDGQNPDAAVLSCSDSRVPPEIIFDQAWATCSPCAPPGNSSIARLSPRWSTRSRNCTSA